MELGWEIYKKSATSGAGGRVGVGLPGLVLVQREGVRGKLVAAKRLLTMLLLPVVDV